MTTTARPARALAAADTVLPRPEGAHLPEFCWARC